MENLELKFYMEGMKENWKIKENNMFLLNMSKVQENISSTKFRQNSWEYKGIGILSRLAKWKTIGTN